MHHFLNLLIWLPILAGGFVLWIGRDETPDQSRWIALFTILITLIISVIMLLEFDTSSQNMQYFESYAWMPSFGIMYSLGVDGLSLLLIALTIFTNLITVLATWKSISKRVSQYLACFLI